MTKKQQKEEIDYWTKEKPKLEEAQRQHGHTSVPTTDTEFERIIEDVRQRFREAPAQAMPLLTHNFEDEKMAMILREFGEEEDDQARAEQILMALAERTTDIHQEHFSPAGFASLEQYAMVHMPIPIQKANKIPAAKAAVDAEWQAHMDKKTWDVSKVRPKAEVIAEATAKNESVHFGYLMDLCHLKHAELDPSLQKYKGRVVFRGDKVRDETGYFAVFTEQGASASQMSAAKFLDAIARMPGMQGQAADAVKAYTQVSLREAHTLLGLPKEKSPDTWISLPKSRRPAQWETIEDPVCPLERNLYGHPLAGLLWERHMEKTLFKLGWYKIPGWECLYAHREKGLFMSVYVDDFKMVGRKENL